MAYVGPQKEGDPATGGGAQAPVWVLLGTGFKLHPLGARGIMSQPHPAAGTLSAQPPLGGRILPQANQVQMVLMGGGVPITRPLNSGHHQLA